MKAYLHTNVDCPKCNGLLARSKINNYLIGCHNPNCDLYGILFEQPDIDLKIIVSGEAAAIVREMVNPYIRIDVKEAYMTHANHLGKTAVELNEMEKRQAFLNAILKATESAEVINDNSL